MTDEYFWKIKCKRDQYYLDEKSFALPIYFIYSNILNYWIMRIIKIRKKILFSESSCIGDHFIFLNYNTTGAYLKYGGHWAKEYYLPEKVPRSVFYIENML